MDGTPSQLQLARSVLQRHGQHSSDNASGPSTLPSCALRSRSISTPLLPCLLTFFPPPTAKIVNDPIQTSAKSLAAWWSASCPRRSLLLLVLLLVFSSFSWVSVTFLAEHSWPYKSPPFPSLLFFSAPPSVSVPPPPSCLSRRFAYPLIRRPLAVSGAPLSSISRRKIILPFAESHAVSCFRVLSLCTACTTWCAFCRIFLRG